MNQQLNRAVGTGSAVMLGLGSMVGTGVFVSLGVAAGITGPSVVVAVAIAALVATCNALSSAQLAAVHPVSGGTYEYGYRFLIPVLGFTAGWMFLIAKSASAATAAIGLAGYLTTALAPEAIQAGPLIAAAIVLLVTALVAVGIRRSAQTNAVIVTLTILSLLFFVATSLPELSVDSFRPFLRPETGRSGVQALLYASALSFVAYTGYGRIATLGEEISNPERNIPRAIATTVGITFVLYVAVAASGVGVLGSAGMAQAVERTGAPLEVAASRTTGAVGEIVLTVGAATALLGVLLNLILGLSRVLLAMGRRRDMPRLVSRVTGGTPRVAVITMGLVVAAITFVGDIRLTWSFSAVTVLIYYALTNLAALRLSERQRRYPRIISVVGLVGCLARAGFVDVDIVLVAALVLTIGLLWHLVAALLRRGRR
jgi:APA family basic amino acid/polyamine antiporter